MGFDAVNGIVRVGYAVDPGEVPAKVFDIRRLTGIRPIGLISHCQLGLQVGGVVGTGLVEELYVANSPGGKHNAVLQGQELRHIRRFRFG